MKLTGAERSKIACRVFPDRGAKFFRRPGRFEPRERQVRRKRPMFTRDAKFFHGAVDVGRKHFQIRRSLDAGPENARMLIVGEKAESAKIESDGLLRAHAGESAANRSEFCFGHLTNKFERHVKILRAHPAGLRRDRAERLEQGPEIFSHRGGKLHRDKKAHASGPFGAACSSLAAIVEEMDARQIERQLRSMPADSFPIAREEHAALSHPTGM